MPIANLQHIQHLKKAIPLPKVPESLESFFNKESLKEIFFIKTIKIEFI